MSQGTQKGLSYKHNGRPRLIHRLHYFQDWRVS
jgi:hypothetical protein